MNNGHEFSYTKADFTRVVDLIYQRAGIRLNESKEQMVYSRLARRLRALQIDTFGGYLRYLEQHPDSAEWQQFTNALTTNLTSFFREAHHFDILAAQMQDSNARPFRIWCSASSTGEEPYSLAMTAFEAYQSANPPVEIIASDLDTHVLETAMQGIYALEKLEKMSLERKRGFFLKGKDERAGKVRVKKAVRDLLEFRQINLLDQRWPLDGLFDAIFCRNVMIYFDQPTQRVILEKMGRLLKPNGLLYVGHSENLHFMSEWFQSCGKTTYMLTDLAKMSWGKK
ncbi:chemotaxis protein CheR [Chitinibacter bivalviorum]|uniref:Chemotaxis protein methyltransferase n=1 Tax=Chitinibacter bivalviorum TaxID=2739434 RepID=A0A7H9BHS0_9NEIS|nr:CheR family methyltransferase [Chitinibacter bivalviorum]QLG88089.1 chemotaxis protein CheR [Chitinibacter bivalviorum]